MVALIKTKQVLGSAINLANKFIDIDATPDQQHDLLLFREIGQHELLIVGYCVSQVHNHRHGLKDSKLSLFLR